MGAGSAGTALITQTAPLAPWRQGDFSNLRDAQGNLIVIRDPLNLNAPFPGNRIPTDRLNPVSLKIQEKFYAIPNFGDLSVLNNQNYRENRRNPTFAHQPQLTTRIDHRFSEKAFVYGRFIGVWWNIPGFEGSPLVTEQFRRTRDLRSWQVSYTQTITSNIVNEARWGRPFLRSPAGRVAHQR
jgi:hypothetical protein